MTVYLDIVWLLNFFIDLLMLWLTAIILKKSIILWRLLIGAFIASDIVLLLFTPLSGLFYDPLGKFLYSLIIIYASFGYKRFRMFMQSLMTFYFVSFLLGGGLFAIHYFLQSSQSYADMLSSRTMQFGDPMSWLLVLIGFPFLWIFSKKRFDHLVVRKWSNEQQAMVTIKLFGHEIKTRGMIDSGNKLYDPITHTPIMFINQAVGRGVIPDELFEKGQNPLSLFDSLDDSFDQEWAARMSLVPYRGIDGNQQLVLTLRPDEVYIYHEDKCIKCKKVMIGLVMQQLSVEQDFDCILHPDMLLKGDIIQSAS